MRASVVFTALSSAVYVSAVASDVLPYPRSATPTGSSAIHIVDASNLTDHADQVTLQTLAGVLARNTPGIYTVTAAPGTVDDLKTDASLFWLEQMQSDASSYNNLTFDDTYLHDFHGLLAKEAGVVDGFVKYDPTTNSTNAALIACAASDSNLLAVGSDATAEYLSQELNIPMERDVSNSTPYDMLLADGTMEKLSDRVAVFQPDTGGNAMYLSDYAVFARAPTVEHPAGGSEAAFAVFDHLNTADGVLNAAFGWTGDEHEFVALATKSGAVVHASDFFLNMAFFSNLPNSIDKQTAAHNTKAAQQAEAEAEVEVEVEEAHAMEEKAVHTVAFIMSDGDNLQILQNDFITERFFNSPQRGSLPVSWSYAPCMAVLMPNALEWAMGQLTANDTLSAGPSGVGYAFPQLFPEGADVAYGQATDLLMRASEQSLVNVIGVVPSRQSLTQLVRAEAVTSIVWFEFGPSSMGYSALHGNFDMQEGVPVVAPRLNLWGEGATGDEVGVEGLVNELSAMPKNTSLSAGYSIVVVTPSHNYSDVVRAGELLMAEGGFEVVVPEVLIARLVANTQAKIDCPMPTGTWADQAGDLPKCSLPGDGTCLLQCTRMVGEGRVPVPVRCDLGVCSEDLSLSDDHLNFLCADGSVCPASL